VIASLIAVLVLLAAWPVIAGPTVTEPPYLADRVASGVLPPVGERLPRTPLVITANPPVTSTGTYGGELRTLATKQRDTRLMVVFGYARLVGYDTEWRLAADILKDATVDDGRIFTLYLRPGHRWSDGQPFTAEDFRFYWEDVANNPELSPGGPERFLLVDGKPPVFEVIDPWTVRYSWDKPNPFFLPALAGARPEYIYMPSHYLRAMHKDHADPSDLRRLIAASRQRDWIALFLDSSNQYRNDNPRLPSLQPWVLKTPPPSSRYIFERNPYFHRVDENGLQLPYIDTVAMTLASPGLIPAKTAAGEADLQARGIGFENYTILKQGSKRNDFRVDLWKTARGSQLALMPNLTVDDPGWRAVLRDARFRRALSIAINRAEINHVIFYGLAREGNDTVLPDSPLFEPEYETLWADYDPEQANALLDDIGLQRTSARGPRRLPDGRNVEIIVETAGEDPNEVAILQLIRDSWQTIGVKLLVKTTQREVLRNRVFAGTTLMSVWTGLENALPTADTPPNELAPTSQQQLYWPKWGQYFETSGRAGEPIDDPAANDLMSLYRRWLDVVDPDIRSAYWHDMLRNRAENVFTLGTVRGVPQPVVVNNRLRNVPVEGVYNWEPGAQIGVYRPDFFWFDGADGTGGH
jgi:peptide/nickel transport system substrate-binding protein